MEEKEENKLFLGQYIGVVNYDIPGHRGNTVIDVTETKFLADILSD